MSLTSPNTNQWQLFANKEYKVNKDRFGSSDTSVQPKRSPTTHPPQPPPPPLNNESPRELQPRKDDQSLPNPVASWQKFAKEHCDPPQQAITDHVISPPSKSPELVSAPLQKNLIVEVQRSELETQQQRTYPRAVVYIPSLPDPPLCFCGKAAAQRVVLGSGTIYECFNTDPSCNTITSPKRAVCTFHIHKKSWDKLRHSLKDGKRVDYNDLELTECPAFNYTFCVMFRTDNKCPLQPLAYPSCFCNVPAVCHQISQRSDNRFVFLCSRYDHDGMRSKHCCWLMWAERVKVIQPPLLHQQPIPFDSKPVTDTIPPKTHFGPRRFVPHPARPLALMQSDEMKKKDKDIEHEYSRPALNSNDRFMASFPPFSEDILTVCRDRLDDSRSKEDKMIYSRRQFPPQPVLFSKFAPRERNPKSSDFIRLFSDAKFPSSLEQSSSSGKDTNSAFGSTDSLSSDSDYSNKSPQPVTVSHTMTPGVAFKLSIPTTVLSRRAVENKVDVDQLLRELEEEERQLAEDELKHNEIVKMLDIAKSRLKKLVEDHDEQEEEESGEDILLLLEKQKEDILGRIECVNIRLKQDTVDLQRSEHYKAIYSRANKKAAEYIQDLEEKISSTEELRESMSIRHFKCRVCFQESIQAALVPCFHCSYCYNCADKLTECAICRVIKFGIQPIALD